MAEKIVNQIMQQKRGTLANWTAKNPVLKAGELGYVTDKKMFKVGDGTTAFNDLNYLKISLEDVVDLLDANGKLKTNLLPTLAIGDTEIVTNDEARFALTTEKVQKGDVVIVTGTNKTYRVIDDTKFGEEGGYVQILTPDAPVQSVNNQTGNITLDTDDISEGDDNLYYTDARVQSKVETMSSTSLADTANILYKTDDIIIDAGEIAAGE